MPFAFSDTEKRTIGKTDNVKTSPNRQVKAQPSRTFFRSALPFLLFFLGNMNAAEELLLRKTERSRTDADLIFVNGNIYTLNEKQARGSYRRKWKPDRFRRLKRRSEEISCRARYRSSWSHSRARRD